METLKIRKATKNDAALLAEFRYRMFRDMDPEKDFSRVKAGFVRRSREYYAKHIGGKNQYDCLAIMDGRAVGCGSILFWDRPPHIGHLENSMGYILNVYVEHEYRRKGISKAIMARLHDEARKRGMRKIGLHTSRYGYPVYRSMGYATNKIYLEYDLR